MGFALSHAEPTSLDHLEAISLQISEQEEQPIFRRRQGAVLVHGKLAGRPGLPIEAPRGHMRVERGLKGRNQLLKLVEGQAGQIQELRGAGLYIDTPMESKDSALPPLSGRFPSSAPRTGQVPFSTSGAPTIALHLPVPF